VIIGLKFTLFCCYIRDMTTILCRLNKIKYFLEGYSSIFDISGRGFTTKDNDELSGFQKDYMAMRGDWQNLGNDMRKAINQGSYVR